MKLLLSPLNKLVTDVVTTLTSKERLKQLWNIPFYSNASYLLLSFVASALFGFAFWIVAARFYSPEDVGLASATIAAMGLVAAFSHLGLGMGLIRFLPHSGKNANSMLNTVFTIGTLTSIAATLIFVAGLSFWSPALLFIRENPVYLAAFVIFAVVTTLLNLTAQTFIAERRAGFALAQGLAHNLLKLPLVILLAAFFHSFGVFASWGISFCVALLLCFFLLLPRVQPGYHIFFTVNKGAVNDMLHFSFANYISGLFWGAPALILPVMVVNMLGAEPNAYFYIAWTVASVFTTIPSAISASLFAEGSYDEGKLGLNIRRTLKMVFLVLIPLVVVILVIADKVLLAFGGFYSASATTLLRILAVSTLPLAINTVYLDIKRVQGKLKVILSLPFFLAAVTIGLSYLLLPRMGINGAGIAWLVSQGIVALVIVTHFLRRWLTDRRSST
jgi:O-antigen/teichoic acid export membrane protein